MTFAHESRLRSRRRPYLRWLILGVVGLLGLLFTSWVAREASVSANDRLQQHFKLDARERADLIISAFDEPLRQFSILQRLFHSVDAVDWPLFEKFAKPMVGQSGAHGFGWAPVVGAAGRAKFERSGRQLWGKSFSITEIDPAGHVVPATSRERYFPVFYTLSIEDSPQFIGLDLYASASRRSLIDRAAEENRVTVSEVGTRMLLTRNSSEKLAVLVAPVYRGVSPSQTGSAERRAAVRGVLIAALDIGKLFDAANENAQQSGLHARLSDLADPSLTIHRWLPKESDESQALAANALAYSRNFELASRTLTVSIAAGPGWLGPDGSNSGAYISVTGVLLTLLLLVFLHRLLVRSALADSLEHSHALDEEQWHAAEAWTNKLSMVVEQNPATIVITDPKGGIEYVNDKFVETTGYSRAEAIGQNVSILSPEKTDDPVFRQLLKTLMAGRNWQGELQARRRDGTLCWERVLVSTIRDRNGTITNYVAIKEDISELRAVMTRLQESESRFRGAVSVMVEGLVILSPEGRFIFANRAAEAFFGFADEDLQGHTPQDIDLDRLNADGTPCLPENYPTSITLREGCEVRDVVIGYRSPGGKVRWVQMNTTPLRIGEGQEFGVVSTFSDITERRRAEEQVKLAFEAIRCSGEGILVTDTERRVISVNPAFEAATGYGAEEVIGKTPEMVASGRHDQLFYAAMHEMLESAGYWQGEVWNRRKNGESYPNWLGVSVVRESSGSPKYYVYIYSDMTERKEAQERIEFLAHHDPLTGLPNRLLLRDRLEHAQAQASRTQSRVALMYLDLDRFKTINDSLGHPVGDALLKAVVDRLKSCVRESDTISRQGGDEFIILLNDIRDSDAVSRVADKIHQSMGEPIVLGNHSLNTSFSIGIALYPDDGDDFDSLLQKADTAMYHSKDAGRNGHRFFTEQMNIRVVEHMTMETQLRGALENQEFVLYYQPQIDVHAGVIVGVEALIRWNSPDHGLVSPARFIAVAEDSGLIVPIGAWVLGEACRQARAWQDAGLPPFVVAVNLSAVQFKRMDLVNTVINALVLSDLDSQWLELELTESILIQDAEATLDSVHRLKALGVKLSVDDFGTGYSSLAYLKRFAVDKLKIDQSFVRDLLDDPDDAAIVRAIIQMARSLKLRTIAEGVENEELANLLRLFHCDEIQGYWLARPMPADEMEAFVRSHQASDFLTGRLH